jgi:hypothetical protein
VGREQGKVDISLTTGTWGQGELALLQSHSQDMSVAEVARMLNRSFDSTESKIAEMGIKYQKTGEQHHRTQYTDAQVESAIIFYLSGNSQSEIARLLDIPRNTIATWCLGNVRNFDLDWDRIEKAIEYD